MIDARPTGASSYGPSYRLKLLTSSMAIPLSDSYELGLVNYEKMRDRVLQVLGKGAQLTNETSIHELVRAGRIIDAGALLRAKEKNLRLAAAQGKVSQIRRDLQ